MAIVRPHGIECAKWEPSSPGAKTCRYYLKPNAPDEDPEMLVPDKRAPRQGGMCVLPDEMLCVEWVRRYGTDAQKEHVLGIRSKPKASPPPYPDDTPAPLVLQAQDPPPPRPPATVRTAQGGELQMAPPRPYEPAKAIEPTSLEALERAGVEIDLVAPHLDGGITLVPARTGRSDRSEMTFREAATIRLIVDAFPGSHVTAYRSGPRTPAEEAGVTEEQYAAEMAVGTGSKDDPMLEATSRVFIDSLDRPFDDYPIAGTRCGACGSPQRATPSGLSCVNGHGGAESVEEDPLS